MPPFGSCVPLYPTPSPCSKIEPLRNGFPPKPKQKTIGKNGQKNPTRPAVVSGSGTGYRVVDLGFEGDSTIRNESLPA